MSRDRMIGEILTLAFSPNFKGGIDVMPEGCLACDGSVYSIGQYDALYSLIGTRFGGDGVANFRVPDLRGRAIVGAIGDGIGRSAGSETVSLEEDQIPRHAHTITATTANGSGRGVVSPAGAIFATTTVPSMQIYAQASDATVSLSTGSMSNIGRVGGGQPHDNMQPYLTVQYVIVAEGKYPGRR